MNRLWVRLGIAFVAVTIATVVAVALLVDWSAGSEFRQYVVRRDMMAQGDLPHELADYYHSHGSWDGVDGMFGSTRGGHGMGGGMGRAATILTDANGQVIYDGTGTWDGGSLGSSELASALPVELDGNVIGYLVPVTGRGVVMLPADQEFLDRLRTTLVTAALAVGGIALLLGLIISRTIAAPLAGLAKAARSLAARQWESRAPVRGTDEITDVARAFNTMADELQRAETLRRSLMADIAHELRTPLTVMQGSLRALLDGLYPLELKEVAALYDETRLLSRLVADLRELALADAGQLPLNIQPVEVTPVLRTVVDQFTLAAESQDTQVELVENGALPPVSADPSRLTQVLHNLLANALRHTPGGKITVSSLSQSGGIRISVKDTGDGIAPETLPYVFDRFYRADESRARASGGTGLGLAIAKAWVEAMGGQIGVDSAAGQGSTFWFTLRPAQGSHMTQR